MLALGLLTLTTTDCGSRLDVKFLPGQRNAKTCRLLDDEPKSCAFFYVVDRSNGEAKPCGREWQQQQQQDEDGGGGGNCTAGPSRLCDASLVDAPLIGAADFGPKAKAAMRRHRKLVKRSVARVLGAPCDSPSPYDTKDGADCEDWCDRAVEQKGSIAPCKFCKCRACKSCAAPKLPRWAMRTGAGVRASCRIFGNALCNATGTLSETLTRAKADDHARWAENHTSVWIDAIFQTAYRVESAVYRALSPSLPKLVAAEDNLGDEERAVLEREQL